MVKLLPPQTYTLIWDIFGVSFPVITIEPLLGCPGDYGWMNGHSRGGQEGKWGIK